MSLPQIEFTEQCMREGMQIESVDISLEEKVELLDLLSATGVRRIMVGSFVSPRYTPQMAIMDELASRFTPDPDVIYTALALNAKGFERIAAHAPPLDMQESAPPMLYAHLCDTFARRNTNSSREQEMGRWPGIVERAVRAGATRGYIGVGAAFGSNFTGDITTDQVLDQLRRAHRLWTDAGVAVHSITLADPMGWVRPWVVAEQLEAITAEWPDIVRYDLHLHNSRGLALTSGYEAIRVLDDRHVLHFDTTAGGIGGCPYNGSGRATGMIPTEDFVSMLESLGIDTGVDLDAFVKVVWRLEEIIGRPGNGAVSKAGPFPTGDRAFDPNLPLVETLAEAKHFLIGPSAVEGCPRPWKEPIPAPTRGADRA